MCTHIRRVCIAHCELRDYNLADRNVNRSVTAHLIQILPNLVVSPLLIIQVLLLVALKDVKHLLY